MEALLKSGVLHLINHVVLPPRVPDKDDRGFLNDKVLLEMIQKSLQKFYRTLKDRQPEEADQVKAAVSTINDLSGCRNAPGSIDEIRLKTLFKDLVKGLKQTMCLELRAQNAGLIVNRRDEDVVFEAFELSPTNEQVISTAGRLQRSFPAGACRIRIEKLQDDELVSSISQTIAKMSTQEVASLGNEDWSEIKDTTHPGIVTDMLMNVLSALGERIDVQGIWKNTREEVFWSNDTNEIWRRSALWLLVRVALQLHFDRILPEDQVHRSLYKPFMIFLHSQILTLANSPEMAIDSELLYITSAKLMRRIRKLNSYFQAEPSYSHWMEEVEASLRNAHCYMQNVWENITNDTRSNVDESVLTDLAPQSNDGTALDNLDKFIQDISVRKRQPGVLKFLPTFTYPQCAPGKIPTEFGGKGEHKLFQLAAAENWAKHHLSLWSARAGRDFSTCEALYTLIRSYHKAASTAYKGLPSSLSTMHLCLLEFWMTSDKSACYFNPLLRQYRPGIALKDLQYLSLSHKTDLVRLAELEKYIQTRRKEANKSLPSVFLSFGSATSFAVRYFNSSDNHQKLKNQIDRAASAAKKKKIKEFREQERLCKTLLKRLHESECEFNMRGQHLPKCSKCALENQIRNIKIATYVWPLPSNTDEAKATIFELQIPKTFNYWRDTTYYIKMNVMSMHQKASRCHGRRYSLFHHNALESHRTIPDGQRIGIVSESVTNSQSLHVCQNWAFPLAESDVCVDNSLNFRYCDVQSLCFTSKASRTDQLQEDCSFRLPSRSMGLQAYVRPNSTIVLPNNVIADVSSCPNHMSVKEYKAFGSIPLGTHIPYLNILTQLSMPVLDFAQPESQCLILQTIHRAGLPSENPERLSHQLLTDEHYGLTLMKELNNSMSRISQNWESWRSLATLVQLSLKLLSFTSSVQVRTKCFEYLSSTRNICIRWLNTLNNRQHEITESNQKTGFLSRSAEISLLCISTFDVEDQFIGETLSSASDAFALFRSMITVQENDSICLSEHLFLQKVMVQWWRSISYRCCELLRTRILGGKFASSLNDAISASWASFRSTTGWIPVKCPYHHWVWANSGDLKVHFNLLTAEILINGAPLTRLPSRYTTHPMELFQNILIESVPTDEPGMEMSAKHLLENNEVSFGLDGDDMLIVAMENGQKFDLVPPRCLSGKLPVAFVENFFHWYDRSTRKIEFRPKSNPWRSADVLWRLRKSGSRWHLERKNLVLIDIASNTFKSFSKLFSPLEDQEHIHVTFNRTSQVTAVELPRIQLDFYMKMGELEVHSRQYRGMIVDSDQRIGALCGLFNKLVLRYVDGGGERLILIPEGACNPEKTTHHTLLRVSLDSLQRAHAYRIDKVLGRIVDNGSLQSKLYLCFLHGLTSHCLPDPLTGLTGTEASLVILRSGALSSFPSMTESDFKILTQIALLSPSRTYQPCRKPISHKVKWNPNLSALSQHAEFFIAVEAIFNQLLKMKPLVLKEEYVDPPKLHTMNRSLLERDLIRSSSFRVDGFGAEHYSTTLDQTYESRVKDDDPHRGERVFVAASAVLRHDNATFEKIDATTMQNCITEYLKNDLILGPNSRKKQWPLHYDSLWISSPHLYLPQAWCSLHKRLAKNPYPMHKFDIMMWLSAVAFGKFAKMDLIKALAAFYRFKETAAVTIPSLNNIILRYGGELTISDIRGELQVFKPLLECPESKIPRQHENEPCSAHQARISSILNGNRESVVKRFALALKRQWPCQDPVKPEIRDAETYLDTHQAMHNVSRLFKTRYEIRIFEQYLNILCKVLAGQKVINIPIPLLRTLQPNKQSDNHHCRRTFTAQDIFSLQAPCISLEPSMSDKAGWPIPPKEPEFPLTGSNDINTANRADASSRLKILCEDLQKRAETRCEMEYILNLFKSRESFTKYHSDKRPHLNARMTTQLISYLKDCVQYFKSINAFLGNVIVASGDIGASIYISPRIPPTFWLQQLNKEHFDELPADWKLVIIEFGLAATKVHRAQRLLALSGNTQDFEVELQNVGHKNWNPMEFPETLLLEAENGFIVREVQEEIARQMRAPPKDLNAVMQLNMGEGKSSVIVPIVSLALADKKNLVRVIVGKPQSKQMLQMLISKLGGLLNRRIFHMPFSRTSQLSRSEAVDIGELYQRCMKERGILLVQPEHLLSFKLMGVECLINGKEEIARPLVKTQQFFDAESRDIVDESDENFSVKFELVYTIGNQRPIEHSPDRWIVIHAVLKLTARFAMDVKLLHPDAIECDDRWIGRFPRVRILNQDAEDLLLDMVTDYICEVGINGLRIPMQAKALRDDIRLYLRSPSLNTKQIEAVENSGFWSDSVKNTLLLMRGLLACGVLRFALRTKRWRVNYGLDTSRSPKTNLAVPYRSKDCPSPRSEFSHPDVVIVLTSLSRYYGGLEDHEMFLTFAHLLKSDQPDVEYNGWIQTAQDLPPMYRNLISVNTKDTHQCLNQIFPHLRYSKGMIDYFLSRIIFPKEMRTYPSKLSASGWDIGHTKAKPTTGFSGTSDSRLLLPLGVNQLDLPEQEHTNALVLAYLLQPENSVQLLSTCTSVYSDAEHLLSIGNAMDQKTRVILDVGAQILELNNLQVAEKWLEMSDNETIKAVIYFNEFEDISVLDRNGRVEPLQISPFSKQLDVCLVYLDEAHTRGTDLRLPRDYRAAVTLGANLTKDRLVQACMRLRKLGKGQSVVFCIPEEIQTKILEFVKKPFPDNINISDVLAWSISETWADLRRSVPLWVSQGKRHERTKDLLKNEGFGPAQAMEFLEDEILSIEHRYLPQRPDDLVYTNNNKTENENINEILRRAKAIQSANFNTATLQEEQERELAPEVEEERQLQCPPPMKPAQHQVHGDLVKLVETGEFASKSRAFLPAFETFHSTEAAKLCDLYQFAKELLVTDDYIRTVKRPSGLSPTSFASDSYHRPVQKVGGPESIRSRFTVSKNKKLIQSDIAQYAPRTNQAYRPLDSLDLYTIGRTFDPETLPRHLVAQLNLFAGQLYFKSYQEYKDLCRYLGLTSTAASDGQSIDLDGFIQPPQSQWGLRKSPVEFLKEILVRVRGDGEAISKTHMGRMLAGYLLEEAEFDETMHDVSS